MAPGDLHRVQVRRALFSTDDKTGLVDLGSGLHAMGIELIATGSTRAALREAGIPCRAAEELTGVGAWFGGRVKTLHPGILGGILAPRTPEGSQELTERGLLPIDLVGVNFYPFVRHLAEHPTATDREEFIDIGGVTLARAAAKNHAGVVVATAPSEYPTVLEALREGKGSVPAALSKHLAIEAFDRCAEYDAAIVRGLRTDAVLPMTFPEEILFRRSSTTLRYGENPHQAAALYEARTGHLRPQPFELLKGTSLSYTNLLDVDAALGVVSEFPTPTVAVVKHATPIGVASGATVQEAIERAVATDPVARYGCVIAVNRPVEASALGTLQGIFVDLLAAPAFDAAGLAALARRPKIKLLRVAPPEGAAPRWEAHSGLGRLLIQEADRRQLVSEDFKRVGGPAASPTEACSMDFAWRVVRHAKSNAIVLAQGSRTVGIGSGQPTRVKSVELACEIAGPRARGAVLASDAFFPFPDGVEVAGKAGVKIILQSGGSVRDPEVLAVAEQYGISMYFTGWRVFRH